MRPRSLRWLGPAITVVGLSVALVYFRHTLPDPVEVWHAVAAANRWWLALATAAQFGSMVMFAQQQRCLLAAFGGSMSGGQAIRLTYARTAISIALPAGAAISGAFALRQFRARGADIGAAAAVVVLSGVQAVAALVVIYLAWFVSVGVSGPVGWARVLVPASTVALIVVAVVFLAYLRRRSAALRPHRIPRQAGPPQPPARRRFALLDVAASALDSAASLSVRNWLAGTGYAIANWAGDVLCLLAVAHALGLGLGVVPIVGAYLAVQVVRQIPFTPGGIGLVEAALLVTLVAAGATNDTAAAVVLTYRLLSCWTVAPIGLLAWIGLRRTPAPPDGPPTTGVTRTALAVVDGDRATSDGSGPPARTVHYGAVRPSPLSRSDSRTSRPHGPRSRGRDATR
jgi:uncharacterized protein (TIRG00374 family)